MTRARTAALLFVFAALPVWAQAQRKGQPNPPEHSGLKNGTIPQLSDKAVAEIRTLQLRQAQLTIQAQQLLAQYQAQREQLDAEIKAAVEKALKESGVDPAKYRVDDASLAIVPNPVPSSAGPSEQKK